MRRLVPIFMSLLSIVTSKTDPINFAGLDVNDIIGRDQWNNIYSKSDGASVVTRNHPQLNSLVEQNQKMDTLSEKNNPRNWKQPERRFVLDPLNSRRTITVDNVYDNAFDDFEDTSDSSEQLTESDIDRVSTFLTRLLEKPSWEAPLVIVNEPPFFPESEETDSELSDETSIRPNVFKRSRYYRRYPHKRKQSRFQNAYDYDTAHFCMPTRDDVFQLLGALHDLRQGNRSKNVQFCNRRRTARTLLTHIRFLGRRK